MGKCKPINCNFKEGDRTSKNSKDTKVSCVGEEGGDYAKCIDGNTETDPRSQDELYTINNKKVIKKILDIGAPDNETSEERKERLSAGYKCICGYNRDSKKKFKGFHESPDKTRHTTNESPINTGLDDSKYRESICWWMKNRHGWEFDPSSIFTTHGLVNGAALCVEAFSKPFWNGFPSSRDHRADQ